MVADDALAPKTIVTLVSGPAVVPEICGSAQTIISVTPLVFNSAKLLPLVGMPLTVKVAAAVDVAASPRMVVKLWIAVAAGFGLFDVSNNPQPSPSSISS